MRVVDADVERALALVDVVLPVRLAGRHQHGLCFEVGQRQQTDLVGRVVAGGNEGEGPRLRAGDRHAEFLIGLAVDGAVRRLRIAKPVVPGGLRPPVLVGVGVEEAL